MSFVALKRDIAEGGFNVFEGFKQSYIAKKEKGVVTLAKNACPHRGFKLKDCDGYGPIKCQYHGQRFEWKSALTHHEFGEFIFAPEFLGASQVLKDLSEKIGEQFGEHKQFVKAPFHLWMQNTADPNHLNSIHKDSFSKLFDGNRPENVYISEFESSYTMRIKDEAVERYKKHFDQASDWFFHYLAFPNLSVTSFLDVFYSIETANPVEGGCEVTTRFFTGKDIKPNKLLNRMALDANIKILGEDKCLVETWASGYRYEADTKWLPGEARIKRYCDEIRARGLE